MRGTIPGQAVTYTAFEDPVPDAGTVAFTEGGTALPGCGAQPVDTGNGHATCTITYTAPGTHTVSVLYTGDANFPAGPGSSVTQVVVPAATATITSASGVFSRGEVLQGAVSDTGGPGIQGVILYYYDYVAGGPSGAVLATCNNCGPGRTDGTWSFTLPQSGTPGIYAFVVQPVDTAINFGTPSNVIYQIVQ